MQTIKTLSLFLFVALVSACASQPAKDIAPTLLNSEWLLEDLGGKGVVDRAQATLAFPQTGKVAGKATCNRFMGTVEIKGSTIHFGPLVTTRMACPAEALSRQEADYLQALANAETLRLEGPYLLIDSKGLPKPLRYTQLPTKAPAAK